MSCHCTHCQKGAGGPYQTNAVFKSTDVHIRDDDSKLAKYIFPADVVSSGYPKEKWFCSVSSRFPNNPSQNQKKKNESFFLTQRDFVLCDIGLRLHDFRKANET